MAVREGAGRKCGAWQLGASLRSPDESGKKEKRENASDYLPIARKRKIAAECEKAIYNENDLPYILLNGVLTTISVGLIHQHHRIVNEIQMYHAACKVEFQPFNRSYSPLTFFIFFFFK